MNWGTVTSFSLAAFGMMSLFLGQAASLLKRATAVIRAWHEFRRSLDPETDSKQPLDSAGPPRQGTQGAPGEQRPLP